METLDPATGRPLPADSFQRLLFITNKVHVYNIPPMVAGKGHVAATWTADGNKRQIFTARLRVIETTIPAVTSTTTTTGDGDAGEDKVKTDLVLEDSSTGQLFAAAPYTAQAVVDPVSDSSRFFALRVQDEAGRKASLGIGFEERSEAFDFGVALQEARKALDWDGHGSTGSGGSSGRKSAAAAGQRQDGSSGGTDADKQPRDYSLKEGETITVNLPGRFGRRRPEPASGNAAAAETNAPLASFALAPPPGASSSRGSGILPPPPSAQSVRSQKASGQNTQGPGQRSSATDLGFDDGKHGEFA